MDNPFKLGVASGDPLPGGVVLWTRLAPEPSAEDGTGGMPPQNFGARYEIAEDEDFRRITKRGAVEATPELGHSVHSEISGLKPGYEYYYRFKVGSEVSPVGKTRTAPEQRERLSRLAFAVASCQNWVGGRYASYLDMARQDLDVVFHVGDYIYERSDTRSLTDYRNLYNLYKSSPDLQAVHAEFPFILVFDDHEVENGWADEYSEEYPEISRNEFLKMRMNAFQAYYENLPLRLQQKPDGPDIQVYRKLNYGDLVEFDVLDIRQYRSDQVPGDWTAEPTEETFDPARTMLGEEQERWLFRNLDQSRARWNVLAQQTLMAQFDYDPSDRVIYNLDKWDGYPAARDRILSFIERRRPSNPIVLSGDLHCNWVTDLKANFNDPDSETIATEFLGTSISSGNIPRATQPGVLDANPHVKFYEDKTNGYLHCTVTENEWRTDFRAIDDPADPNKRAHTLSSWVVESGHPGARSV
jgi:alkaline phosphatase D